MKGGWQQRLQDELAQAWTVVAKDLKFLARQWEWFGDRMRDEAALMREVGLAVVYREEFGPWRCMRVVGER